MAAKANLKPADVPTAAPRRCGTHRGVSTVFWLAEHRERSEPPSSRYKCVCMCVYVCKHVFMWLYGCASASLSTRGMEGTKETFPLTFDPGLCAANQTPCVFLGGEGQSRARCSLFLLCLALLAPLLSLFAFAFSIAP